jgi:hypothetical protein
LVIALHSQRCGEHIMNIQHYKQRLLDLEKTLSARIGQEADQGRREFIDSAHDVGDASVADEVASEEFTEAEHNADVLQQVRDALGRWPMAHTAPASSTGDRSKSHGSRHCPGLDIV